MIKSNLKMEIDVEDNPNGDGVQSTLAVGFEGSALGILNCLAVGVQDVLTGLAKQKGIPADDLRKFVVGSLVKLSDIVLQITAEESEQPLNKVQCEGPTQ